MFKGNTMKYIPPEYMDEDRIRILMGLMPSANESAAYNGRLNFWTSNLHNWIRWKEGLTFTIHDAQMAFRKGTQVPLCFPEVFQHMIKQGEIISYEDLNSPGTEAESWSSWSRRVFVSTPSRWAWNKLQNTMGNKSLENTVFVDWIVLQEVSDKILSDYFSCGEEKKSGQILTADSMFKIAKEIISNLTLDDLNLILHCLARAGKATLITYQDKTFVKLAKPGQTEAPRITQAEIAEHQLIEVESKLKERITSIQEEISPLRLQAKQEIMSGSKKHALTLLRRRKRLEKSLETSLSSHENVLTCLQQLQDSKLNLNVLNAFQMGVNALKHCISDTGSPEEVAEHMDSLQDVLDECGDISEALSSGILTNLGGEDDETLMKELEELMANQTILDVPSEGYELPSVPDTNPLSLEDQKENNRKEAIFS